MSTHAENLRKEIQKILYEDLEVWKQHINNLETKKIDVIAFKKHYVEFLQNTEEKIIHFTSFYLKKESHKAINQIIEDDLEKTALLQTVIEFLPIPLNQKEKKIDIIKDEIIHRKFQPSANSSPIKEERSLLYPASEIE